MKQKINIAELLKDCPKGMELYSPMYGVGKLTKITNKIHVKFPKQHNVKCFRLDGKVSKEGEIMLFPNGKTTWEGFHRPFKDGDVVTYKYENGLVSMILNKFVNFVEVHYHCALYDNAKGFVTNNYIVGEPKYTHLATEVEKAKLFQVIKENGYYWNAETKTLEKLVEPKFKVGDRIQWYDTHINHPIRVVKSLEWDRYRLDNGSYIKFGDEHAYKLLKFDITTLKPFDKVLVRTFCQEKWKADFFSHYTNGADFPYSTVGKSCYYYCIPYEGNEHLLGTADECDEFYKNW